MIPLTFCRENTYRNKIVAKLSLKKAWLPPILVLDFNIPSTVINGAKMAVSVLLQEAPSLEIYSTD